MRAAWCVLATCIVACGGPEEATATEVDMVVHVPCVRAPCAAGGEAPPEPAEPVMTGRPPAVMLALGWEHTCALASDGSVFCWGSNADSQLGDIGRDQSPIPARVPDIPPMSAIWAGADQTCARARDDGQIFCWGDTGLAREPVFAQPLPFTDVRTMGLAYEKGCFVTGEGALYCWGDYGRPHGPIWDSPHRVPLEGATALAGSMNRHCAVSARGRVTCWGMHPAYTFVERQGDLLYGLPDLRDVVLLALDDFAPHPNAWIVDRRGRVLEATPTGRQDESQGNRHLELRALEGLENVVELHGCGGTYCARTSGGTAACWGDNQTGSVGDGTTARRAEPRILPLAGVEEIAVGKGHACARAHGSIFCWGDDEYGQVGAHAERRVLEPAEVAW